MRLEPNINNAVMSWEIEEFYHQSCVKWSILDTVPPFLAHLIYQTDPLLEMKFAIFSFFFLIAYDKFHRSN